MRFRVKRKKLSTRLEDTLHKISTALVDLERAQQIANEQVKGILQEACQHFLDVDVVELQNTRQKLDKSTSEYNDALNKFHTKRQKEPSDVVPSLSLSSLRFIAW